MESKEKYTADLNNGYYLNPIFFGDYPDPSIIREGEDYYMTHSSFEYAPGLLIWHSKDLINWEPICSTVFDFNFKAGIWAPDITKYKNNYYIYFAAAGTNWVTYAPSIKGPWSEPIDLKVKCIDPGHCVDEDGNRYLHLSIGNIVKLSEDGLSVISNLKKVYNGWKYPQEWRTEGFCLEGPKILFKNGYYYLISAQGGTAGPATSHMVVAARSKSIEGPWENSPYNPIVRTKSKEETWWSKGHGTIIDTPQGDWWIVYHAYLKGYHNLGRMTLLEPIEWTEDGWFKTVESILPDKPIKKPCGQAVLDGIELSDKFNGKELGYQWRFFDLYDKSRYILNGKAIVLKAIGEAPKDCNPMLCIPFSSSYEASVKLSIKDGAEGGLVLFYDSFYYCGIGLYDEKIITHNRDRKRIITEYKANEVYLKVVNECNEVSFYYSSDSNSWTKLPETMEVSGYNHNVAGGFLSLKLGIYSCMKGEIEASDFKYISI